MRILVGIMYCIENELEQCIASIQEQTYTYHDHFIVDNLPNKEAHEKLYQTFMDSAGEYDLFIKIDADMVLARKTFFQEVVDAFKTDQAMDFLQIAVHDFFTSQLIYGLHVYKHTVKWKSHNEQIFVDQKNARYSKRVLDNTNLAPAAYHCPDPSPFQSFHFGLHKAVKVMQIGKELKSYKNAIIHWSNIQKTRENFLKTKDLRLGFAALGAEIAFKERLSYKHVNFKNSETRAIFESIKAFGTPEIQEYLDKEIVLRALRFHPALRFELLFLSSDRASLRQNPIDKFYTLVKNITLGKYKTIKTG